MLILDEPFSGLDPLMRDELISGMLERAEGRTILISSHDQDEIESFASHIGFLSNGRIEFSEELQSLLNRFRRVEVICSVAKSARPSNWMDVNSASGRLDFIDSQFEAQRTVEQVRAMCDGVQDVQIRPMALREIVAALLRKSKSMRVAA